MTWLFDYSDFVVRSRCGGGWTSTLIFTNQISNAMIWLAYMSIPISLYILWLRRRTKVPKPFMIMLFAHFIFFCGLTHLCDIFAFYYPAYRIFTLISLITAISSAGTSLILPNVIIYLFKLPSFEELRLVNERAQEEILRRNIVEAECLQHNMKMREQLNILEKELKDKRWIEGKYDSLNKLREMLEMEIHFDR